jgi:hypothetical protein
MITFDIPGARAILSKGTRMDLTSVFLKLAIALGLGLLVGIEREHVAKKLGGSEPSR